MMIRKDHPLASVRDSFNAVFVHGDAADDAMFYGRGAGEFPTASAVMGDVIDVVEISDMAVMEGSVVPAIKIFRSRNSVR